MSFLSVALCSSHFVADARCPCVDAAWASDTESSQNSTTQLALISVRGGDEITLMTRMDLSGNGLHYPTARRVTQPGPLQKTLIYKEILRISPDRRHLRTILYTLRALS